MGKGSARRPPAVTDRELADRWAVAFGPPRPIHICDRAYFARHPERYLCPGCQAESR